MYSVYEDPNQQKKPQEIKSSLGIFEFADTDKTYQVSSEDGSSIHVFKNPDNSVAVVKTIFFEGSTVHCRLTIPSNGEFDKLVIFSNKIKLFQTKDASAINFTLPETFDEIEGFINVGGSIELETARDKKILNDPSYQKYHFEAVGKKVFMKGQKKEVKILSFDKDIDTIFSKFIVFTDGTVKELKRSLFDSNYTYSYRYQIEQEIKQECEEARKIFTDEVENLGESDKTPDGHNVKKIFIDIDKYLQSHWGDFDYVKKKYTYEKLTKWLKESKNPGAKDQIVQEMGTIMLNLKGAAEDIAIGVISIVAGVLLVGVGFLLMLLPAMLVPATVGAFLAPALATAFVGTLILLVAGSMLSYGIMKLSFDTPSFKDFQYNKNLSRLTDFFISQQSTIENNPSDHVPTSEKNQEELKGNNSDVVEMVVEGSVETGIVELESNTGSNNQGFLNNASVVVAENAVVEATRQDLLVASEAKEEKRTNFIELRSGHSSAFYQPKDRQVVPADVSDCQYDGDSSSFNLYFQFCGFK